MSRIIFGTSDATPMSAEEAVGFHERRQFQCLRCGRFAKHLGESQKYDGSGTQLYVSWSCSRCGECTEGLW